MHKTSKFLGFTLVELIVVITIVGILSTVGFVSYSGYLSGARDSNRMSQLTKISDSLQVYAATKSLPLPDNYVEIQASGSTIAYQGEVGVDVLETIDYTNGGTDPKDDSYYTYYLTKDRKSLQLLSLMEEQSSVVQTSETKQFNPIISNSYAADYSDRFPKVYGRKLGTLTQVDTNTPIQQLSQYQSTPFDVVTETSQFIAHVSDDEKIEGTGSLLQAVEVLSTSGGKVLSSCKSILDADNKLQNKDGIYPINPSPGEYFDVYCDMTTDGGGWTFFGHVNQNTAISSSTFSFNASVGNYRTDRGDDETAYSINASTLDHTEMMATLDTANPQEAQELGKLVFYKYDKGATAFYSGPNPCVGLGGSFYYKISISGEYEGPGTSNVCTNNWYARTIGSTAYLALFSAGSNGNYWGSGMGGNNDWGHDGWWYVR